MYNGENNSNTTQSKEESSSPAYLGRNPLNYEKRKHLYYINKNL
jgi:hypothetical protein